MLEESLAKLDGTLTERMSVPLSLLENDYTGIPGSHPSTSQLYYRLLATAWAGPWGSIVPWLLPPSTTVRLAGRQSERQAYEIKVVLRLPQSRIRHFLCDASLFFILSSSGAIRAGEIRITSAILRLGPDRVLQNLDSEFACNISLAYRHNNLSGFSPDVKEKSIILPTPLFFEMPLKILPLFIPNSPLPEIEYTISVADGIECKSIHFFTETITSPGEADILPAAAPPPSASDALPATIIQYLPSFKTETAQIPEVSRVPETTEGSNQEGEGSSGQNPLSSGEGTLEDLVIPISTPEGKLARAIYIRVFSKCLEDIPDAIMSVDVVGPPPRSRSLFGGEALPGSICRSYFKTRFSSAKDPLSLPYYVLPFAATPGGNTADYGVVLAPGSTLKLKLYPDSGATGVQACVETFERVVWKR